MNNPPTSREELAKEVKACMLTTDDVKNSKYIADFIISDREQRESELRGRIEELERQLKERNK